MFDSNLLDRLERNSWFAFHAFPKTVLGDQTGSGQRIIALAWPQNQCRHGTWHRAGNRLGPALLGLVNFENPPQASERMLLETISTDPINLCARKAGLNPGQ
jgi:hypothetical protein